MLSVIPSKAPACHPERSEESGSFSVPFSVIPDPDRESR